MLPVQIGSLGRIINYPVCGPIIRWMIDKYARLMLLARREVGGVFHHGDWRLQPIHGFIHSWV